MADRTPTPQDAPLPSDVVSQLAAQGITTEDEVELRHELERHVTSYTLFRLTPAAARKWKARYRIMLAADYLDCQSVAEAYARALLTALTPASPATTTEA